MANFGILDEALLLGLAFVMAMAVCAIAFRMIGSRTANRPNPLLSEMNTTAFLFDGPRLLDATPNAQQFLKLAASKSPGKADIIALLEPRFPGLQERLNTDYVPHTILQATDPVGTVAEVEGTKYALRLTIKSGGSHEQAIHPLALATMKSELEALRHIGEDAPQLIWKQDAEGGIIWTNRAYLEVADRMRPPAEGITSDWPPIALFPTAKDTEINGKTRRLHLVFGDGSTEQWYDVTSKLCDGGSIHFATDAGAIVFAEKQGKLFIQTLTKTFADLSTGLAIFDRSRRLVMFNPSLLELTRLPVTFLSGRPVFSAVLDRLRDEGMLPEPKNYATWRDQVADLEAQAKQGTYCETWTLPGGQTYRVTGRPHPDGALAFLIEDISAEISLTRTFRAELKTAHAVIDTMTEAIAVFSPAGTLIMSNQAYDAEWTLSPGSVSGSNLSQEVDHWKCLAVPTPFWQIFQSYGSDGAGRRAVIDTIRTPDGRHYTCRLVPLIGGATLVGFQVGALDGVLSAPMPSTGTG